jgi:putative transposase
VSAFTDMHRDHLGVEPICQTLDVSASAYYQRASGERSDRVVEDERLTGRIREVHEANYECYGYRRVHAQLSREHEHAGRDQVARLMRCAGIHGAKRRGKPWRTTIPDPRAKRPSDLVNRDFTRAGAGPLVGRRLDLPEDLGGPAVLRVHRRRVLANDRRLAARLPHANHAGARRAADGAPRAGR